MGHLVVTWPKTFNWRVGGDYQARREDPHYLTFNINGSTLVYEIHCLSSPQRAPHNILCRISYLPCQTKFCFSPSRRLKTHFLSLYVYPPCTVCAYTWVVHSALVGTQLHPHPHPLTKWCRSYIDTICRVYMRQVNLQSDSLARFLFQVLVSS